MAQHRRKNPSARRERALARRQEWSKRTPVQQLAALESMGHGHCRQAKRLRNIVASVPVVTVRGKNK